MSGASPTTSILRRRRRPAGGDRNTEDSSSANDEDARELIAEQSQMRGPLYDFFVRCVLCVVYWSVDSGLWI